MIILFHCIFLKEINMNEARLLNSSIHSLRLKLMSEQNIAEKQVLLFYINELKKIIPCPEDEQFRKPGRGIGGSDDKIVFQKLVCRDNEGKPLYADKKLRLKTCVFDNLYTYVDFVSNNKKPQKQFAQFYNGMPLDDYIVLTHMMSSKQNKFY